MGFTMQGVWTSVSKAGFLSQPCQAHLSELSAWRRPPVSICPPAKGIAYQAIGKKERVSGGVSDNRAPHKRKIPVTRK